MKIKKYIQKLFNFWLSVKILLVGYEKLDSFDSIKAMDCDKIIDTSEKFNPLILEILLDIKRVDLRIFTDSDFFHIVQDKKYFEIIYSNERLIQYQISRLIHCKKSYNESEYINHLLAEKYSYLCGIYKTEQKDENRMNEFYIKAKKIYDDLLFRKTQNEKTYFLSLIELYRVCHKSENLIELKTQIKDKEIITKINETLEIIKDYEKTT